MELPRRRFVQGAAAVSLGSTVAGFQHQVAGAAPQGPVTSGPPEPDGRAAERIRLVPLSARLSASRWQEQVADACEEYLAVPVDDLLYGFRKRAGMPTPGKPMTGWASGLSEIVFGQIISGLSRIGHHLDDADLSDRAVELYEGWRETVPEDGNVYAGAYGLDKYVCGMVDLQHYGGHETMPYLKKMLASALDRINDARPTANAVDWDGRNPGGQNEWYTLSENAYRAYLLEPDDGTLAFARHWHYPSLWDRFEETAQPSNPPVAHAYSHVNSFNGPALAYAVTGEQRMLDIAVNAFDWLNNTQTFATGGYGPIEHLVYPGKGRLGSAVEHSWNHAEIGCGTWGGFKLSTHLTQLTGQARFLDWAERLLYNAVGAALRADREGHAFYYADYRITGGAKAYYSDTWPCCAGTYIQDMAAYHELLYYQDTDDDLYVALYLPSTTQAQVAGRTVKLTTETDFPESEEVEITVDGRGAFRLNLRIPGWCEDPSVTVNGEDVRTRKKDGWRVIDRSWRPGDTVRLSLPMALRLEPVDSEHPDRNAVMYGPVALAQRSPGSGRWLELDDPGTLTERVLPTDQPLEFEVLDRVPEDNGMPGLQPLYAFEAGEGYRLYFDSRAEYAFQPATEAGGARFEFQNVETGAVLGIAGRSQRDGALTEATDDTDRPDQYWRFVDRGDGVIAVHNSHTDRFLGLKRRTHESGAPVSVWEPDRAARDDGSWALDASGPGTLQLRNRFSGKVLAQGEDGAVVQESRSAQANSDWRLLPYGSITLVNRHSWRAMDIPGGTDEPGATVQQWFKAYGDPQRFEFVPVEDGWFMIINIINKLAITAVTGPSGGPIQQLKQAPRADRLWRLDPVRGPWFSVTNKRFDRLLTVTDHGRANEDPLTLGKAVPGYRDHLWRLD